MKILNYLLSLPLFIYLSCTPDTPNTQPIQNDDTAIIKYKINGTIVKHINTETSGYDAKAVKQTTMWPEIRYLFEGHIASTELFQVMVITDSLKQINYHYDSTNNTIINIDHNSYALESILYYNGDYFDVNITSYSNGKISGFFSGKLSPQTIPMDYTQRGTVLITEGEFINIGIRYN